MREQPLVSVITPCYNGGNVVHRLLQSIIDQTYQNIEFIFVNDGSTDNTEDVLFTYKEAIERKGIRVVYIKQENKGLGGAINAGLKRFSGDYFIWPDSDDYLTPTSIEIRVAYLERNPRYGSVSSNAYIFNHDNLLEPICYASNHKHRFFENQFWLMIQGKSLFCSGCHMLRTTAFLSANPERQIYASRYGQNNQLLLPVYYKYPAGFIDIPLYNYIRYPKSMSVFDNNFTYRLMREEDYWNIMARTIERITMSTRERNKCIRHISINLLKQKLRIAYRYQKWEMADEQIKQLINNRALDMRDLLLIIRKNKALDSFAKTFRRIHR